MTPSLNKNLKVILAKILEQPTDHFTPETPLFGVYPELDSVGIVNLLIALETCFLISINDADLNIETFATFGSLYEKLETLITQSDLTSVGS